MGTKNKNIMSFGLEILPEFSTHGKLVKSSSRGNRAQYKSFETYEEAEEAYNKEYSIIKGSIRLKTF